jgi:adenosylcobinamide-GDP ribazoletransferase
MIHDAAVAFTFLTRIPLHHKPEVALHRVARWFPLVGAVVGGLSGASYWLAAQRMPTTPAAALALLVSVLVTGGFHQDGLADIFDGLVGGWTPEDRLRILKDSRHGTYGVLAIVLQVTLQISCISSLTPAMGCVAIITAHTLARVVPVLLMFTPAAPGQAGMGAAYSREIRTRDLAVAATIALCVLMPLLRLSVIALAAMLVVPNAVFYRFVRNKIGGIVGDALGAAEQISESAILLAFVIAAGAGHA